MMILAATSEAGNGRDVSNCEAGVGFVLKTECARGRQVQVTIYSETDCKLYDLVPREES